MISKTILRAAGTAFIALGSSLAAYAAAADTWVVTTTGQIAYGFDTSGIFGTANQDLTGLTFTQTIVASVDPALWNDSYTGVNPWEPYTFVDGSGPLFTDIVTVDGHSATFVSSTTAGQQFVSNGLSQASDGFGYDYLYSEQQGFTSQGDSLNAFQWARSLSTKFVPNESFDQGISQNLSNHSFEAHTTFQLSGNLNANFQGSPTRISISVVPEADIPAMLLAGLAILGVMSRRKAAKVA